MTYSRNKYALRTRLRNLNSKSLFYIFDSFRDIRVHIYDFFKYVSIAAFIVSEITAFIQTEGQTDRSTRLVS